MRTFFERASEIAESPEFKAEMKATKLEADLDIANAQIARLTADNERDKIRADASVRIAFWARHERDALLSALEVIALRDSADPAKDAAETLIGIGFWSAEAAAKEPK